MGARFPEKCLTLYLRRLKSHVLTGRIKGSFNDYHKSGLLGGEGGFVHTVCYWINVLCYLFKACCMYHYCIQCFYQHLLKRMFLDLDFWNPILRHPFHMSKSMLQAVYQRIKRCDMFSQSGIGFQHLAHKVKQFFYFIIFSSLQSRFTIYVARIRI